MANQTSPSVCLKEQEQGALGSSMERGLPMFNGWTTRLFSEDRAPAEERLTLVGPGEETPDIYVDPKVSSAESFVAEELNMRRG